MKKNIILITVDTLRYDTVNKYSMPNITNWAQDKIKFDYCFAQSSWTRASFASLLTGLYPHEHGCLRNVKTLSDLQERKFRFDTKLKNTVPYVPEILKESGFFTICIQGNPLIGTPSYLMATPSYGFDRGFDEYINPDRIRANKFYPEAFAIKEHAVSNLKRLSGKDPFFMWINFMDPHCPYLAPKEYYPIKSDNFCFLNLKQQLEYELSHHEQNQIYLNYLKEVIYVDDEIQPILDNIPKNSIVIFTSDHGEEFWDHGNNRSDNGFHNRGVDHGHTLYNELIRVPLIMDGDDETKNRLRSIAEKPFVISCIEQKEIFPIIFQSLEELPLGYFKRAPAESPILSFSEALLYGVEKKAYVVNHDSGQYKLILSGNGLSEIYNISDESHEIGNQKIRREICESVSFMNDNFDWFTDDGIIEEDNSTEEATQRLKALGYL